MNLPVRRRPQLDVCSGGGGSGGGGGGGGGGPYTEVTYSHAGGGEPPFSRALGNSVCSA